MGKDLESLEQSRAIRSMLKQRWGSIPRSIMQADWSDNAIDLSTSYQEGREGSKHAGTPFDLSGIGARHGQLSRFPQNIAHFATSFYTPEKLEERGYFGNYIPTIIDPFHGHNSRMQAVYESGRNYVGWDISKTFCTMNRQIRDMLLTQPKLIPNGAQIELVEGDSRDIHYHEQFDLCLTSPPFWDLEDYGDEPEQLGRGKPYRDFLHSLAIIVTNCYRALKPGTFIVWEFNDFTKDGIFYPYAFDAMNLFKLSGFALHQVIIIDYGRGFLSSFAQDIEANKLVSKEHSYLVVGYKHSLQSEKRQRAHKRLAGELEKTPVRQGAMF